MEQSNPDEVIKAGKVSLSKCNFSKRTCYSVAMGEKKEVGQQLSKQKKQPVQRCPLGKKEHSESTGLESEEGHEWCKNILEGGRSQSVQR